MPEHLLAPAKSELFQYVHHLSDLARLARICVQDVLVEIAGVSVLGSSLEDAARLLKGAGDTVR